MTTQAASFDGMCGCTDPVYISMRTGEGEGLSPVPLSYPVQVFNVDGDAIRNGDDFLFAMNKAEYIDIWNSDGDNQAVGTLGDLMGDSAPFSFILRLNDDQGAPAYVKGLDGDTIFDWKPEQTDVVIGLDAGSGVIIVSWGDGVLEQIDLADLSGGLMDHTYDLWAKYQVKIWVNEVAINTLDVSENALELFDVFKYADAINTVLANDNNLWRFNSTNLKSNVTLLRLGNNQLTSFDSSNLPADLIDLEINGNKIPTSDIENTLAKLIAVGLTDGAFSSQGQTPPAYLTSAGNDSKDTLTGRGWDVNVDEVPV